MSGVFIHDGRRPGQRSWTVSAVRDGVAIGTILSPFATPRVAESRHPNAKDVVDDVRAVNGEVFFDAMTHARLLPGTNKLDFYDQWEMWGPHGVGLGSPQQRLEHVERVFALQTTLGTPLLTPTLQLSRPDSSDARIALATARLAAGLNRQAGQSLVGTRSFWASGAPLDAFVGSLAGVRSPLWVLTLANELVVDGTPDMVDSAAQAGLARTVHSLSLRSRVIVAHADYAGLPAIAAGADAVGSGWDRGQKTFDPLSYRVSSDAGIRIPASYVTQGGMHAVLRRSVAEAIEKWNPSRAAAIREGVMPPSDQAQRVHHLARLTAAVNQIANSGSRQHRVAALRHRYLDAGVAFDELIAAIPGVVRSSDRAAWMGNPSAALEAYAGAEGF